MDIFWLLKLRVYKLHTILDPEPQNIIQIQHIGVYSVLIARKGNEEE